MIADRDTNAPQGYREGIGAQGVTGPILTLEGPRAPLSLPGQPDQSLGFANVRRAQNENTRENLAQSGNLLGIPTDITSVFRF